MDAAQAEPEIIDIAAQHTPNGSALRAPRQGLHRRDVLAVIGRRGVACQHDAVESQIGGNVPGVFAGSRHDLPGIFGRPGYGLRFPQLGAQFLGEIGVRLRFSQIGRRMERFGAQMGERRIALTLQLLIQAPAD